MERKLKEIAATDTIPLGPRHRYVIFSDHHKGARNSADDFRQCEQTYLSALDYYNEHGFTLVILGDSEELLEEKIGAVVDAYQNVFQKEARFHPDRLIRVFGNHDVFWRVEGLVKEYMHPFFPGMRYREGLKFQVMEGEQVAGEIFLIHGFQGTLESDIFAALAKLVLPYYRNFQIKTRIGSTSPSRDACLRSQHDNHLYRWVSQKRRLIMIAGHTHRPVWSSKTHLEKLVDEVSALLRLPPDQRPPDYAEQVLAKKSEIEERQNKFPPCNDIVKTRPAYFNTGCCRYADGDITGIEIKDGDISLIRWGEREGSFQRKVLESNSLSEIFFSL
jgi:UDP-2,3-diacylglucosamine pyrophosphatase LpxH